MSMKELVGLRRKPKNFLKTFLGNNMCVRKKVICLLILSANNLKIYLLKLPLHETLC